MNTVLQSQLENERARYERLIKDERKDLLAQLVLKRMEREIVSLERLANGEENRHKSHQHRCAGGFIRYVRQVMHRFRNYKERRHYPIFSIPASATLQTQAGIK